MDFVSGSVTPTEFDDVINELIRLGEHPEVILGCVRLNLLGKQNTDKRSHGSVLQTYS